MTPKQRAHMVDIIAAQSTRIQKKYPKGQKLHGGKIWEKPGMVNNAEEEVTDLITYLHVIRQQIEFAINFLKKGKIAFAIEILEGLNGNEPTVKRPGVEK